jgi:hypothetical protein
MSYKKRTTPTELSKSTKPDFIGWLVKQNKRRDPIGDLARDFLQEPKAIQNEIRCCGDLERHCGLTEICDRAWSEFLRFRGV